MPKDEERALWMECVSLAKEKANAAVGVTKDEKDALYFIACADNLCDLAVKRMLARSTVVATEDQKSTNSSTE